MFGTILDTRSNEIENVNEIPDDGVYQWVCSVVEEYASDADEHTSADIDSYIEKGSFWIGPRMITITEDV